MLQSGSKLFGLGTLWSYSLFLASQDLSLGFIQDVRLTLTSPTRILLQVSGLKLVRDVYPPPPSATERLPTL